MRTIASLLLGAILAVTSVAAPAAVRGNDRGEAHLAKLLDGRIAGKPVHCINSTDIRDAQIVDGTAIVYRVGANRLYVNRPVTGARSLDRDDILVTRPTSGRLCNVDIVRLLDRTARFPTGSVGLGDFVPYTKVARR